jgi:hypothetical protein
MQLREHLDNSYLPIPRALWGTLVLATVSVGFMYARVAPPLWTIDLKTLGAPAPPRPVPELTDRALRIGFSAANEVLVSFILPGGTGELETRQSSATQARLEALLLDATTGGLIRRQEWTAEAPPTPRIARLADGGFVLVMGNRLQVLDESFRSARVKTLDVA